MASNFDILVYRPTSVGGHENKTVSTAGIFSKTLGGTFGIRVLYVSPKYLNLGFVRF